MNRIFKSLVLSLFGLFLFAGVSFASSYTTSVRLQQPGTPTNQDTFNIVFVALDTNSNQPITVQCYKQGPGDSTWVAFGSPITLSNGGNTASCQTNSGIVNQDGTYSFEAVAQGSTQATSNTVSVDFNNETPGTPTNYNKTQPNPCTYKISFHTADDNNETVKVVLYRSTDTSFSVDSGHQVNSVNIGSNQDGSMTDNVSPNCNTTYYYVIRAFDKYGNGSGVVGDANVTVTNVTTTPTTTTQQGAIPISAGQGGSVLGTGTGAGVLGTESAKPTPSEVPAKVSKNPVSESVNWIATHKTISLLILLAIIIIALIAYYLYRRYYKRVE